MEKPIRILHVVQKMDMGGTENFIMNLYRVIDKEKFQFDFAVHTKDSGFFDDEIKRLGGNIFVFNKFKGTNIKSYTASWNQFFKKHPEISIVHGHMGSSASIYLSIAKKNGRATIAHSHSTNTQKTHNLKNYLWEVFSYPTRYIAEYRYACGVAAGKARYGNDFLHNKKRDKVIFNGINTGKYAFNLEDRQRIRALEKAEDAFIIGHIGRFVEVKNHQFLLGVFKELVKINENSQLWLLGDGPLKENIQEQAKSLGVADKVKFFGIQKNVIPFLQAFDAFVMPSLYEGLPVTLIEAQASGLSCIISDTIDSDVDVSGQVVQLSLNKSANDWAHKILEISGDINLRYTGTEKIKSSGYDINQVSNELVGNYKKMLEEKEKMNE